MQLLVPSRLERSSSAYLKVENKNYANFFPIPTFSIVMLLSTSQNSIENVEHENEDPQDSLEHCEANWVS